MAGRLAEPARDAETTEPVPFLTRIHPAWWLALAVALTLLAQAPVLGHYFYGDDFVPLADVASRSTGGYLKDLFLLNDITPNWRFLTGIFYLIAYRAFGTNAAPYLATAVAFHVATAALVFLFVRRTFDSALAAFLAAACFGLSPASVPTVGQVTAINNVFGAFFVVLSLVLVVEAFERERRLPWIAAAVLAFVAAIASNESLAVLAPVPALLVLWRSQELEAERADWLQSALVLSTPFLLLGVVALAGFGACGCTEAADGGLYGGGSHLVDNTFIYLGRLLYPVGQEPLGDVGTAHLIAGIATIAVAAAAFARGPNLVRILVLFLAIALVPYLPLKLWSAPRYVYLASVPFSMLAGVLVADVASRLRTLSPALPALAIALAVGVLGLFVWQTWSQNETFDDLTRPWDALVAGVEEALPSVPPESTVYVVGSELSDPLAQCVVMPSVGEVVWGDTKLFTFPDGGETYRARPGYSVFLLEQVSGAFRRVELPEASPGETGVVLLPHVPPEASGNLCTDEQPAFPEG